MKRYLVFYGDQYYPQGGMDDLVGEFNEKDEAIKFIEAHHYSTCKGMEELTHKEVWCTSWAYVYDIETRQNIYNINHEETN